MNFFIKGKLIKLDPNRGKMASIVIKDNRQGQHWIIYLDLLKTDLTDLSCAKLNSDIEVSGFVCQKNSKTFFVAQKIVVK